MFCVADTDPENSADNLLTKALRLFDIADQFQADSRISGENYSGSPLVCSDVGVTSFESGHLPDNEVSLIYGVDTIPSVNLL